jgi:hypothetical protein
MAADAAWNHAALGQICAAVAAVVGLAYPLVAGWFDAAFVDASPATNLAREAAGGAPLMASHIWLGYRGSVLLYKATAP